VRTVSPRTLVVKKLEGVSKLIFRNYYKQITELIGNSHGIYALYDENELYYVGKSTDLKNRVKQHLKDRHLASWTHFSLYLVRKADHISEIESLIIRVANPKGNTKKYKTDKGASLLKELQASVKVRQQEEFNTMFNKTTGNRPRPAGSDKHPLALDGLVRKKTALYRTYKGKEYRALLTPRGKIKHNGKIYETPTAAAKSIVNRTAVNGWTFWYFKNAEGEWARLSELRGKS
jgi:predicted GIY-YIG superfamily endonuclease